MEISHSNFNITDLNYGLVEGTGGNIAKNQQVHPQSANFALNTSPFQTNISFNQKKRKNNKRLNAFDNEYLNDFDLEAPPIEAKDESSNFFIPAQSGALKKKFSLNFGKILEKIPVLNSFLLTKKSQRLKNTLKDLNEINQNVDEMLNGVYPYGENDTKYGNIAQNLVHASNIIGKVKNDIT